MYNRPRLAVLALSLVFLSGTSSICFNQYRAAFTQLDVSKFMSNISWYLPVDGLFLHQTLLFRHWTGKSAKKLNGGLQRKVWENVSWKLWRVPQGDGCGIPPEEGRHRLNPQLGGDGDWRGLDLQDLHHSQVNGNHQIISRCIDITHLITKWFITSHTPPQ